MTAAQWAAVRRIFDEIADLPPASAEGQLEERCAGDPLVAAAVRRLLHAHQHETDLLDRVQEALAPSDQDSSLIGRRLGNYRISREIGRGGMGSVYLAERVEGVIRKQVAVKLVRAGLDEVTVLERFRREREILAGLDHPGIARLIDGGSTEEGLPYFVMDYVEGQPIDRWCDQRRLNVTDRLILFRSVCAAVQYAHQNLVVHRDLKPGNILVTADGTVKLLDFGIAKVLTPQPATSGMTTQTIMPAMTLVYASPEQVKGEPITTLTDVYSLGVVLYELLTGRQPYSAGTGSPYEMERLICEQEPASPSTAGTPEAESAVREGAPVRLKRRLEGDLDNIVLMALRKDPRGRYSSVEQFSEDLRLHLAKLPVIARPDTFRYLADKLIRRHPVAVATAVLVALSTVLALGSLLWATRVAMEERMRLPPEAALAGGSGDLSQQRILTDRENQLRLRTILAPQILFGCYLVLLMLAGAVYVTRASVRRTVSALAGGALCTLVWLGCNQLGYFVGWWHSDYPGAPDPLAFVSRQFQLFIGTCAFTAFVLTGWRIIRRYGWQGQAGFTIAIAVIGAVSDRMEGKVFAMVAVPGLLPYAVDGTAWALGITLAMGVMRIIAGPPGSDRLARTPTVPAGS